VAKIKNLSPKFKIKSAEVELQQPVGLEQMGQRIGGLSAFSNSFKRGYGNAVFGSDENGIWLGAADWEDGPFRVDMAGNATASSMTISGYIVVGGAALDVNNGAFSISADKVNISGSTTFSAGYDPTDKVAAVAGNYTSDAAAGGARVRIFPTANVGIQVTDDNGANVFIANVGGDAVGDVVIGDFSGGNGMVVILLV